MIEKINKCEKGAIVEVAAIKTATIDECANKCKGVTKMFAYGTNDFGELGCHRGLCKCHCICMATMNDDTCEKLNYDEYWFLEFEDDYENDGKLFLF